MAVSKNPIQFGINPRNLSYERNIEVAKAAEAAGFDKVAFSDRPPENNLEGWTLATAIGVQTSKLVLTHSTLNVPLRNPAILSKMATALDTVTGGGRVLLSLGAAGQENHSTTYGIYFGTPGERVDGLIDAIEILRGTWANESFTYTGKRYSVNEAVVTPKPINGAIPIFVGALGPRMLRLAGRMADGWLKNGGWPESPEAYAELLAVVEASAEKAGRDPQTIARVVNCTAYVGPDDPARHMPGTFGAPGGLMGAREQVLDIIDKHVKAGVDTFHIQFANDIIDEQIPKFGEEIIKAVKGK